MYFALIEFLYIWQVCELTSSGVIIKTEILIKRLFKFEKSTSQFIISFVFMKMKLIIN